MKKFISLVLVFCSAASASQNKVAFLAALTGMDPNTARELNRGVEVFKKTKPALAKQMELTIYDTKGDLKETFDAMAKLEAEGFHLFIGLANSNEAMVASKYAAQHPKVVFVTPFATNPEVTKITDRAFRVCFDDNKQGLFLSELVNVKFSDKKILVLENIDSLYSGGLTNAFRNGLLKKVDVTFSKYSSKNLDTKFIAKSVAALHPNLVFIPDSSQNSAIIVREIFKKHKDIQFLGGDGWGGNAVFHAIQGKDENLKLLYSTYWHKDMQSSENITFQKGYKSLYPDGQPSSGAAFTYDAFHLVGQALTSSKNYEVGDALANQIAKTKILSTTGPLKFVGTNRTPDRPIVLLQLKNGEYVVYKK